MATGDSASPGHEDVPELLRHGELEVQGRLVEASNATLLCTATLDGASADCVYKPVRGERPLWDFPDGTLAGREVAAYLLAQATGWGMIPPTLLRDGPFGSGMVQLWIHADEDAEGPIDVLPPNEVPESWRVVLHAQDPHGDPVVLAHADELALRRLAVLDVVLNNADRKGGHVLRGVDGNLYGIDHGVCLNTDNKLRTVLWGWIGEPLPEDVTEQLGRVRAELEGQLAEQLAHHLTGKEVRAVADRVDTLLEEGVFPAPSGEYPAIPWPPF